MSEPDAEPDRSAPDPTERVDLLLRDLRSSRDGLSSREAARRLVHYGPNELARRGGRRWPGELARQFTHPLALLLWVAAALAWAAGIAAVALAIVVVIILNAAFAFVQEIQAERAVEALAAYLPAEAKAVRDGRTQVVPARSLVPGDVLVIEEGDRISADARLMSGSVDVDTSTLTGESMPVYRAADLVDTGGPRIQARDLVFSGTTCTEGEARAVVFATGMHTELGRIAALSERVEREESPLETQVRRVAWLIALIAVVLGLAFIPIAVYGAHLSVNNAMVFAIGLLVGNVPEGLLPVITLALALGVRAMVRRGAVIKRLSAVETLGSTDVICTDKTGTLTENRVRVTTTWTAAGVRRLDGAAGHAPGPASADIALHSLATVIAYCNNAEIDPAGGTIGEPTEAALLEAAARLGVVVTASERRRRSRRRFRFDPVLKLMSTLDERDDGVWVDAKGAPEALLPRCASIVEADGRTGPLTPERRLVVEQHVDAFARAGLRVLAVAERRLDAGAPLPNHREAAERDLVLLGLAAMLDPPRPEVAGAVADCHNAGIRIIVISGDHALTAAAIAGQVGTGGDHPRVVTGAELDRMPEQDLDALLREGREMIFARSSPEAKLRIADAKTSMRGSPGRESGAAHGAIAACSSSRPSSESEGRADMLTAISATRSGRSSIRVNDTATRNLAEIVSLVIRRLDGVMDVVNKLDYDRDDSTTWP